MKYRPPNICHFCSEEIKPIYSKAKPDFVGDTFLRYETHVCKPWDIKFHYERIVCPECDTEQLATVEHTQPFYSYVHECVNCQYIIMESEWQKASPTFFEPE